MAIQDFEKRQLAEIERQLTDESPELARKLAALGSTRHNGKAIAAMIALYLAGLTVIIAGVQVSSALVIVLGAVLTATVPAVTGWYLWRTRI